MAFTKLVTGPRHQFAQAFKAGAAADFVGEDNESMWDACTDVDTGGNGPGAIPMPDGGAPLSEALLQQVNALR